MQKLGKYLDVKRGPGLPSKFYAKCGNYIRLTLGNFNYPNGGFKQNDSKEDIYYTGPIKSEYILKEGDLITPLTEQVSGLLGETALIPESSKYIQNGDIGLVLPIENKLDKVYCYYLLSSSLVKSQLGNGAQQTKIRHTSPEKIKECIAPIPDITLQKKIGHILFSIDNQIKRNNDMVQKLQVLNRYVFDMFFGNDIYNFNNVLSKICKFPSGYAFEPSFYKIDGEYQLVTIKNVNGTFVDNQKINHLSTLPSKMKSYCCLHIGDILLSLTGNVGRISINTLDKALLNQRVSKFICDEKYKTYLYLLLNTDYYQEKLKQMANGTSQKNLSPIDIENLRIYIPENIDEFNKITTRTFERLCKINIQTAKLKTLKDKLLPLLINQQLV